MLAAPVRANGVDVGSRVVFSGDAGPYSLNITTIPVPGTMHFNIYLVLAGTDLPVGDARLTMRGASAEDGANSTGPVAGYGTLAGPQWYATDLPVNEAGAWEFTLTIDGAEGTAQVTFPVGVREPPRFNLSVLALIAVALAILGFTLGNRLTRGRRKGHGRRRPGR